MAFRDPQPIALSRQSVLLVTAVGVGLIALSYILGVQVGKGSASLRKPDANSTDQQLKELPEPLLDQLKLFQSAERTEDGKAPAAPAAGTPPGPVAAPKEAPKPEPRTEAKPEAKTEAKAGVKPEASAAPKGETGEKWTLQLVSTAEKAEADRVAAKAKAAGFPARVVKDGKTWKVRLVKAAPKEAADAAAEKMRGAGFKPFAVRAD